MTHVFRPFVPAALLLLAACSTVSGAGHAVPSGQPFELRPGDTATLAGGGTLRYERLVNDSRCRPDVQCIWAGDAEVAFAWTPPGKVTEHFSLHTKPEGGVHPLDAGRRLRLVSLARGDAPAATLQVDPVP